MIDKTFTATIEDRNGWTLVAWPESVAFFGSTKSVKVRGKMDDVPFQTAFMPWGDGTQFLPVSKKMLKALNKQPGDSITVYLKEKA